MDTQTTPSQMPETPPPPVSGPKNLMPVYIAIGVLVVAGLAVGAYFIFNKDKPKDETKQESSQKDEKENKKEQTEEEKVTPAAVSQTYTNEKYSYQFGYPNNTQVVGFSDFGNQVTADRNSGKVAVKYNSDLVFIVTVVSGSTVTDQIIQDATGLTGPNKESATVAGTTATRIKDGNTTWYFVVKNNLVYVLKTDNKNSTVASINAGVLASFKLTSSQQINSSDWPTFSSKILSLSFKHPGGFETSEDVNEQVAPKNYGETKMVTVANQNADITITFASSSDIIAGKGDPVGDCCAYFSDKPLNLGQTDQSLINLINKEFNQSIYHPNDEIIFDFKRVTIGGKKGVRFFRINEYGGNASVQDTIIIPMPEPRKNTDQTNLMLSGPSLFDKKDNRDFYSNPNQSFYQYMMTDAKAAVQNQTYNANVKDNYALFNEILTTLKITW